MTFSIAARCAETGQLGIAISSSSIAVGARCPWLLAGVGAVSSQNITLPALGPQILARLEQASPPVQAIKEVLFSQGYSEYRQVLAIDAGGNTAFFSGEKTLGIHRGVAGKDCVAGGNMLRTPGVVDAMVTAFGEASGLLAERLLVALQAGLAEGGEAGPIHSAALKVMGDLVWPVVDLRVDWADNDPIGELHRLWRSYEPQMDDYILRAIDPSLAPGYGVPGDER